MGIITFIDIHCSVCTETVLNSMLHAAKVYVECFQIQINMCAFPAYRKINGQLDKFEFSDICKARQMYLFLCQYVTV